VFESLSLYICPFAVRDVYVVFGFCHDREVNRRGFLSALIAAGTAAAIDPEKLLWAPGRKLISIPKPRPSLITDGWVNSPISRLRLGDMITYRVDTRPVYDMPPAIECARFIVAGITTCNVGDPTIFLRPVGPDHREIIPMGPEDFQGAARIARGSSHRGME
jgi:hypothetical protein